ncbi:hypothetical protein [Streptomyces colonosanans]|nr:hypothetical protein [Streptomyces colonosanans]
MMFTLMVWGASSAAAGGPTSVLVTSPTSEEATALYVSDKKYEELQQLLDRPTSGTRDRPSEADLADTRQINVTWLAHDISPWRLDQVLVAGSDAVWIYTTAQMPELVNGIWHRAADPARLRTLFKKLGVMGRTSNTGYAGVALGPWQSDAAATPDADATTASPPVATSRVGGGTDWWWAIPGAAAGAVLALVLRPLAARLPGRLRRHQDSGPRQELRDA